MLFNYSIDIEFHLEAYYVAKVHALAKCSRALLSSHPASAARNSTAFKDGFGAPRAPLSLPITISLVTPIFVAAAVPRSL